MQPISASLAKIAKECEEAGATQFEILKLIKELEQYQNLNIDELRLKATEVLNKINPKAAQAYKSFTRMKVFTSQEKIKPFDMGNIVKSLLRETRLQRSLAQKIGNEVEEKLKDLNLDFLNTALIRELANVKLLEYGKEEAHFEYCRHGMPTYDIKEKLQKEQFLNRELLKEFHLYSFLPRNFVRAYFSREIFVEDIEFFSNRIFSYNIEVIEDNFEDLIISTLNKLSNICNNVSFCGISNFNLSLAYALRNENNLKEQDIDRKIKFFLRLLNSFFSLRKNLNSFVINLSLNPNKEPFASLRTSYIGKITTKILKFSNKNFYTALIVADSSQLKSVKGKANFILISREEEIFAYIPNNKPILCNFALKLSNNEKENIEKIKIIEETAELKLESIKTKPYLQEFNLDNFSFVLQLLNTKFLSDDLKQKLRNLKNFKIINCISNSALKHFSSAPEKRIYNIEKHISLSKKIPNKEFYCLKFI